MVAISPISARIRWGTGRKRGNAHRKTRAAQTAAARQAARAPRDRAGPSTEYDGGDASSSSDEDVDTVPDTSGSLAEALRDAEEGKQHYRSRLYAETKKLKRAQEQKEDYRATITSLRKDLQAHRISAREDEDRAGKLEAATISLDEEVARLKIDKGRHQQEKRALQAKVDRVPQRLEVASGRAVRAHEAQLRDEVGLTKLTLQRGGVIPDATRSLLADLVALDNIPAKNVVGALKRIASALEFPVEGDASTRSVNRVMKEGGAAAHLEVLEAMRSANGITISSDGTTHKNVNLESRHATIVDKEGRRKEFFLGITMAVNHTSETQFEGWMDFIENLFKLGCESEFCADAKGAADYREFWMKLTGMLSDHAEDQKKLFRLLKEYKRRCEREVRGEQWISKRAGAEGLLAVVSGLSKKLVERAGGVNAWEALPASERSKRFVEGQGELFRLVGETVFQSLSDEAKTDADFILWAGCCMHKEMNAFKGFCVGLEGWWAASGKRGPIKLYNRDNAATVKSAAGTDAATRAETRSKGGAVKLTSLAGAVFRHKDRKRGQQDTLRFYFDAELGFTICFPDTSNTRFQSHANACAVIITHLDLLIEFMEHVRNHKGSGELNHMEQNVIDGFRCRQTQQEIVLIVLYAQCISAPYMREIRGPFRQFDSVLEQGPLHRKVISHLEKIATHPDLLLGSSMHYETASLDGKPWDQPEAVYAAQRWIQRCTDSEREDMGAQLRAACTEAVVTWRRFSAEFTEIEKSSKANTDRTPMANTNDANEAGFGGFRRAARHKPNLSLPQHNARTMYKHNGTSSYMRSMDPAQRAKLREITRAQDESGENRQNQRAQAEHLKKVSGEQSSKRRVRADKRKAAADRIDAIRPLLDVKAFDSQAPVPPRATGYLSVQVLDDQLDWHARKWPKGPVPAKKKERGDRAHKLELVREAIIYHLAQGSEPACHDSPDATQSLELTEDEVPMDLDTYYESDAVDSEEEWWGGRS
ncbi:hypothetical protein EV121DRAFT_285207 [Schizophyllum commune]